ncbi:MAG: adenosylhomocysteinase, partial [Pseudomonadota bacterium]|nr:adenosylhomocysteinase [Pseudomonadota bacterium]
MSTAVAQNNVTSLHDYKVADISLAGFGRREITLAEAEMPALMS